MSTSTLTTKARVKERLQITVTDFDDLFDRLILGVSARIETICSRTFALATYTNQLYDGSDIYGTQRFVLILKNAPVASISSIQYKAGPNSSPTWYSYDEDDYDIDLEAGLIYFKTPLPRGKQNIRITYTAGYSGYSIGVTTVWVFNATPTGTVNGTNRTFTLPENASQIVVYADGIRISSDNYTFTADTDTFTFDEGSQPFSTISVDYLPTGSGTDSDDPQLPLEIVEICEEAVVRLFKRRDSEGRSSETFDESSVTWRPEIFTPQERAAIKNYRRASFV